MDHKPNQSSPDDATDDLPQALGHESNEIVPLPGEQPTAPPVDIDQRGGGDTSAEPIQLPDHQEWDDAAADEIEEHQPLPVDDDYHDDDSVAPDPYDVDDQVDLHMPRPTRDPGGEVDDASTSEELDVNTAPGPRGDAEDDPERVRYALDDEQESLAGDRVYAGGPNDHDPVNMESDLFQTGPGENEEDDAPGDGDDTASTSAEPAADTTVLPGAPVGETTCPICGRQTDALRFCGHCGAPLTKDRVPFSSTSLTGRLLERAERLLDPLGHWTRPGGVRFIMAAGGVLVLLALLANNGALALMIGAAILPLILVFWAMHSDIFEREPLVILTGIGAAGTLVGAILGWLGALIVAGTWFDTGVLNYGAAGLGGAFAKDAGVPPFLAWSLVGIVFPLLALVAIIGIPLAMRQTVSLRNEIMDGLTLGALMGAGVSIGSAIVFAAPMLTQGGPVSDASAWTLTIIGVTVIRPLVWTLCGGLLGVAAWRYLLTGRIGRAFFPAVIGASGVLLFSFVSIQISASGLWPEILWGVIVVVVISVFYMRAMHQAIDHDRAILGNDDSRIVCPHCHQVTPDGQFCAHCGQALHRMA